MFRTLYLSFALPVILLTFTGVNASRFIPSLSVDIKDGLYDGLECLQPKLTWESSSSFNDKDLKYGYAISANSKKMIKKKIWGVFSIASGGWNFATKAEAGSGKEIALNVNANCNAADLQLNVAGNVGLEGSSIKTMFLNKRVELGGGTLTVKPLLNISERRRGLAITFENNLHALTLASNDVGKMAKVSREFGPNVISSTIKDDGSTAFEIERSLGEGNAVVVSVLPNKFMRLRWIDRGWTTVVKKPFKSDTFDTNISKTIQLF